MLAHTASCRVTSSVQIGSGGQRIGCVGVGVGSWLVLSAQTYGQHVGCKCEWFPVQPVVWLCLLGWVAAVLMYALLPWRPVAAGPWVTLRSSPPRP